MKKAVSNQKNNVILCIVKLRLIALIGMPHILYDHWLHEEYLKGHIIEITYETVDGTPPPEPEGTRIY